MTPQPSPGSIVAVRQGDAPEQLGIALTDMHAATPHPPWVDVALAEGEQEWGTMRIAWPAEPDVSVRVVDPWSINAPAP